ncbi:MAG TPA: phage holin family protein [Candidatus Eisenbacteria bacterium]|jgi:putative membrane protein|nr:phage holin family protein [Candidatus Eisenbacteria bacterium]
MRGLLIRWVVTALALWLTAVIVPGLVSIHSVGAAIIAALVLGLVNAIVRPVLLLLTLPFTIVTLGLFIFILNAAMFGLAALLAGKGFEVHGFWGALVGSLLVSVISLVLNMLIGEAGKPKKMESGYNK